MRRNDSIVAPRYPRRREFAPAVEIQRPRRSAVVVLILSGEDRDDFGNALRLAIASSADSGSAESWVSMLRRVECCAGTRAQE